MKILRIPLLLVLIAAFALSSCTSKDPEATEAPGDYPAPEQGEPPKREETPDSSQESYPAPEADVPAQPQGNPYPFVVDGGELTWVQAMSVIRASEVVEVVETQSLKVILTMKDGRTLIAFEPVLGEVIFVIESCGEFCKDIIFSNE